MSETTHATVRTEYDAQQLQDEAIELAQTKEWPDPRESWFMNGEAGPNVVTSVATSGRSADLEPVELAGGMSPAWGQPYDLDVKTLIGGVTINELNVMPKELKEFADDKREAVIDARKHAANVKVNMFLETIGGSELANDVVILKPQTDHYTDRSIKGTIVNADELERTGNYITDTRPAFMMYSNDPERVLAIRPADCPTIAFSAKHHNGTPIHGFMHAGWQDEDAGFTEQGMTFLAKKDIDFSTMNVYIAPGGVDFGYSRPTDPRDGGDEKFTHPGWKTRINNVVPNEKGVRLTVDMQGFAVDRLKQFGITDEQLFVDSTDTSALETGHSSHKQATRGAKPPMRDLVVVMSPEKQLADQYS